jgi:menaquinol-cytochrome c reductase cytochrome b/c subunit
MASSTKPGTPRGMQPPDTKPVRITVPEGKTRYGDPFFPKVFFEALFPISGVFIALVTLALVSPAPLQDPADPLNHAAIDPRPEWYFMFLFQLLKYTPGVFIVFGTVIIPTIVVILLLLLPFYDRNWARKINRRPVAAFSMTLGMLTVMFLTWGGFGFPTPNFATTSTVAVPTAVPGQPTPSISPAVAQIFQAHCAACHIANNLGGLHLTSYAALQAGGNVVPGPVVIPGDHAKSTLWQIIRPGGPWPGNNRMPLGGPYLSDADINTIASWIDGLGKGGAPSTGGTAATVSFKKDIQPIFAAHCATCHISIVSGGLSLASYQGLVKGGTIVPGPVFTAGDHAHSVLWQIVSPGTGQPGGQRMPLGGPYLSDAQIKTIADWIDQGAKDN